MPCPRKVAERSPFDPFRVAGGVLAPGCWTSHSNDEKPHALLNVPHRRHKNKIPSLPDDANCAEPKNHPLPGPNTVNAV